MGTRRANGEGSFKVLPSGRIQMRKAIGTLSNGRPKVITVSAESRSACIRLMKEKEQEWKALVPNMDSIGKMTLTNLCMAHLNEHLQQKDRIKPKAADRRESTIKNQIAKYSIGFLQVQAVSSTDVSDHIEFLISNTQLSVSSIKKALDVINSAFKWAISKGYLHKNPCSAVMDELTDRLSKLEAKRSCDTDVLVMSEDEEKKFELVARKRNFNNGNYKFKSGLPALFLLHTGMRCGELCALKWKDYHRNTGTISIDATRFVTKNRTAKDDEPRYVPGEDVVKNAHAREIELNEQALSILEEIYELAGNPSDNEYVLLNDVGKPTNPTNFGRCVNVIYREADLDDEISGLHILRRTFATRMYDSGAEIKSIAAYLGDLESTVSRYYIAIRKKIRAGNETKNIVPLPARKQ